MREILDRYPGKFLIFTEYRVTLEVILEDADGAGAFLPSASTAVSTIGQKEAAVAAFRGDGEGGSNGDDAGVRVMVSTESGAEGRNLQFCHQLINYDLPWNPMRVEQRIGRLHRLGQERDVTIFNLSCNETIEAHVIDLLAAQDPHVRTRHRRT